MVAHHWICALVVATLATQTNAAAILLSLLKELQKESLAINHLAGISSQWCSDAEHQSLGMSQVVQGQLDDATIAVQQIRSDEKRLQSELTLAQSTQQQREQQLQDASGTSKFAAAEFASEQEQLSKTIAAAQHAMRLVKAQMQMDDQQQQQLGSADEAVNNLLQTSADHMTDDEKSLLLASDQSSDSKPTGQRPQQLLQTLTNLHARLSRQQTAAFAEHQVMALRLWSFTDHLNSSIMESKSQAAAIGMEMAQRKREHTRLSGKIAMLQALANKAEAGAKATTTACSEESQHKASIQKYIEDESNSVRTTLKRMPSLSSELLFDLSNVLPTAPSFPSFLQLRGGQRQQAKEKSEDPISPILKDLDAIAHNFPEDSSSLVAAEHSLIEHRSLPKKEAGKKPQDGINGFASSSIQDIYAFLKSDEKSDEEGSGGALPGEERMLLSNSGDLKKVTGVYQKLLDGLHSKEKAVDDQLKWCGSIARDAKLDSDAVARSLKMTGAKLNLVNVAMSEYQGTMAFNKQQQTSLEARDKRLQKLTDVKDSMLRQAFGTLKEYGQQLLSLASELNQKPTADEHKGAALIRSLWQKLEKHQGLLEQWQVESKDRRQAVATASKAVQQALAESTRQASRRLARLKAESQVLTSLSSAKAKDNELSQRYVHLSQELCSASRAKELQAKGNKLRREATSIQKSLAALTQPEA